MKLSNRHNSADISSLIENNITDWRFYIQHPSPGKFNSYEAVTNVSTDNFRFGINKVELDGQLISLYCTILGLVIICLVGYVVYKIFKQKNNALQCAVIASKDSSGNSLRLTKCSPSYKSGMKEMSSLVNQSDGWKCSSFEEFLLNQQLCCLPEDQIEAIVFSLSDESSGVGWVNLAQFYNVGQEEIDSMMQNRTKTDTIRVFLKKWSENPNHTLKKLIKSLQDISRPDTAFLVKSSLKKLNPKDDPNHNCLKKGVNNNSSSCQKGNSVSYLVET